MDWTVSASRRLKSIPLGLLKPVLMPSQPSSTLYSPVSMRLYTSWATRTKASSTLTPVLADVSTWCSPGNIFTVSFDGFILVNWLEVHCHYLRDRWFSIYIFLPYNMKMSITTCSKNKIVSAKWKHSRYVFVLGTHKNL